MIDKGGGGGGERKGVDISYSAVWDGNPGWLGLGYGELIGVLLRDAAGKATRVLLFYAQLLQATTASTVHASLAPPISNRPSKAFYDNGKNIPSFNPIAAVFLLRNTDPIEQAGLTVSLPQAPRKDASASGSAWSGKGGAAAGGSEEVPCSQAEVLAAATVAAHNPFPGGEVGVAEAWDRHLACLQGGLCWLRIACGNLTDASEKVDVRFWAALARAFLYVCTCVGCV